MPNAPQRYLLDTNIISDVVRNPQGVVAARIAEIGEQHVCTSIVVASELRFGAEKSGSARLKRQLERVLGALDILPLETPVDRHYAEIRLALEKGGQPIGPNDLLIASQARALGLTVITANLAEFARVPGLTVENWLGK
jgi:tRNA(fMet)-specific endonuclease VapC